MEDIVSSGGPRVEVDETGRKFVWLECQVSSGYQGIGSWRVQIPGQQSITLYIATAEVQAAPDLVRRPIGNAQIDYLMFACTVDERTGELTLTHIIDTTYEVACFYSREEALGHLAHP